MADFWRAFLLAKNQWGRRIIVGIAMLIDTGTLIVIPLLLKQLFDNLASFSSLEETIGLLNRGVLLFAGIALLRFVVIYAEIFFQEGTGNYISHDIRQMLFRKMLSLPFRFFDKTKTGDLMSVLTKDVDAVRDGTGFVIMLVVVNALTAIGITIAMFRLHALIALIILSMFPLLGFVAYWYAMKVGPKYQRVQKESGKLHTVAQENISGIRVVKAFNRHEEELKKFEQPNSALYRSTLEIAYLNSLIHPALDFLGSLAGLVALGTGGIFVIRGEISLGTMVAFTSFAEFLVWPIRQIGWLAEMFQRAIAGAERIYKVLNEDSGSPRQRQSSITKIQGDIRFEQVSFAYHGGEEAITKFSLTVKAGQKVCLLGMTGSGKTTVANLLPRFYDPTDGVVLVDGKDIHNMNPSELREQIGFVFQDNFLFSTTLRDNLTMGKEIPEEQIWESVRAAQAEEFIVNLPNGLDTVVGERGVGLSGGERQRIAIARALLRNPRILIFDDSTSSLDMRTEASLKKALDQLFAGRTVLIIAQRVSTAQTADHIVVMDSGQIAEQGTHSELLSYQGIYSELNRIQNTNMNLVTNMGEVSH